MQKIFKNQKSRQSQKMRDDFNKNAKNVMRTKKISACIAKKATVRCACEGNAAWHEHKY